MNFQRQFKYTIGQQVQNKAFGYNAVVIRRMYVDDGESAYNAYDLALWASSPPTMGENIPESQIAEGHRIE